MLLGMREKTQNKEEEEEEEEEEDRTTVAMLHHAMTTAHFLCSISRGRSSLCRCRMHSCLAIAHVSLGLQLHGRLGIARCLPSPLCQLHAPPISHELVLAQI